MENGVTKKSKLSTAHELKKPTNPAPKPQSYPQRKSEAPEEEEEPIPISRKRPSSPTPKFVSESDLEDESSYDRVYNPLIRNAQPSWDMSQPSGNGGLRLIKRRKVSNESCVSSSDDAGLLPSQAALAKQLAARRRKETASEDPPIRPNAHLAAVLDEMNPVIRDDLVQVKMYEDSWLSMLEASVTQLVNAIFATYEASLTSTIETHLELRREMITLYASFSTLHKRIQASLACGALSPPKDFIVKSSGAKRWGEDIGLKRRFIDLFMNAYEVEVLGIALEVVIGRELFGKCGPRLSNAEMIEEGTYILSMNEREKMKLVERFLEKFVVQCEDAYANPPRPRQCTARIMGTLGLKSGRVATLGKSMSSDGDWGSLAWGLRKSLLRAFMLILLMDKAKTGANNLLGARCLFRPDSPYKTSVGVLHALARMLLPSLGDIARPLSSMGYMLQHAQHPLEEYKYTIENLAVDMRDGVRLVRLVELLLYPTEVQLSGRTGDWPLSKAINYPTVSRVQKINNVALALEALEEAGGVEGDVKAEDIVDGYRERTVGFLWKMVGRWGLETGVGGLVDWSELRKEIRRLKKDKIKPEGENFDEIKEEEEDDEEERGYVALLKSWAKCIANRKGLTVENMTTSFADGKVFEAIVEEYEGYFPKKALGPKGSGAGIRLEQRLRELGCSTYFASMFGEKAWKGRVFDRSFIIGGLVFLCSRLLQWSIRERAAVSIQRTFRAWKFREVVHKRIALLLLAHDCAAFVQSKERIMDAAITIQRAFRTHLQAKLDRLIRAVIGIQCFSRGYLVRRELQMLNEVTVKIQRWWRELREQRYQQRVRNLLGSIVRLQAVARAFLERKRIDDVYYAVGIVGAEYGRLLKGRGVRQRFLEMKEAAIKIQRWYRTTEKNGDDRRLFLDARNSTTKLQALVRGKLVRSEFERKRQAAITIQRHFRSCKEIAQARHDFTTTLWAAMVVQIRRRATVEARKVRCEFLKLRTYTIAMQREFRGRRAVKNAAVVIQQAWRKCRWMVRMRKFLHEVVAVQSLWRGYAVRKQATGRIRIIRRRVLKAIAQDGKGGEDSLGVRNMKALGMVKGPTGLGRGLLQLELTTRCSHECSVVVAQDEGTMKTLTSIIETATKQLAKPRTASPSKNLVLVFNILNNIATARKAGDILAGRSASGIKDVFTVLLNYLIAAGKQPSASNDLYLKAIATLREFCVRSPVVKRKLAARWKWLEGLSMVVKMEKGKCDGAKGTEQSRVRGEKLEEVLQLIR
ncbi:hypothetical protein BDZ91DRAFT_716701 [Kalaharituber pfeilii]|nr:hypothetical protein BDZ91DRAFT_716701 [Kalaharituber pfeilii]